MITAVIVSSTAAYAVPFGAMNGGVAPSRPQPHLVGWRDTLAPFAFVKFSTQQSDQCSKRGEGAAVELTGAKRALLQRINFEINNEITHSNEADDDWKVGARVGDCEDFALTKRQRLLDAGWPSGALQQPARNQASAMRFWWSLRPRAISCSTGARTSSSPGLPPVSAGCKSNRRTIRGTRSRFETWRVAPGDDNYVYAIAL